MSVMSVLALIFFATFVVESSVEYFIGTPMSKNPKAQPYTWMLIYISAILSVLLAFYFKFDMLYLLSAFLEEPIEVSWVGIVMTGLVISRGSNFLHQIVTKFFPPKS